MVREYGFKDAKTTDQAVARYEKEVIESLETDIQIRDEEPHSLKLEGEIAEFYEDRIEEGADKKEEYLALGTALGRYVFENLTQPVEEIEYREPIFTQFEQPLWQKVQEEIGLETRSEYFEHGFSKQREISEELGFYQLHNPQNTTASERDLFEKLEGKLGDKGLNAAEIAKKFEEGKLESSFKSATARTWISTKMNRLVNEGFFGKYKKGKEVLFTDSPREGFKRELWHSNLDKDLRLELTYPENTTPVPVEAVDKMNRGAKHAGRVYKEFCRRFSWEALNRKDSED